MPIYEYKCKTCELTWEAIRPVRMREEPLECPCGGETEIVPSVPAAPSFEGDGWTERFYPRMDK